MTRVVPKSKPPVAPSRKADPKPTQVAVRLRDGMTGVKYEYHTASRTWMTAYGCYVVKRTDGMLVKYPLSVILAIEEMESEE